MNLISRSLAFGFLLLTSTVALTPSFAQEDEDTGIPGAPRLLPEDTLAYIRVDNADQLREGLADSSVGKMLSDPALSPFASQVYQAAAELFEEVGSRVGITLDELLAIPTGQVAIAAMPGNLSEEQAELIEQDAEDESEDAIRRRIARKRRQQNSIGGLFLVEAGSNLDKVQTIIDRIEAQMTEGGYVRREVSVGDEKLVRLLPPRPGRPEIEYFSKDETMVLGIGNGTAAKVLDHWLDRGEDSTLADRADFTSVMSRCVGAEDTRPQITFFVDPLSIVERLVKRGGAAAIVWPIMQNLGIEKIRGIGGSSFRGGEFFDDITHFHVLVDPPRDGLFGVLRPENGDTLPPNFVPEDVTSYTSVHWDFEKTYENLGKIFELVGFNDGIKQIEDGTKERLGISVQDDIVGSLDGRFVSLRWVEPPIKLNSQARVFAFSIKDETEAKSILAKIRDTRPGDLQVETIAGRVVYVAKRSGRPGNVPENLRQPTPCAMVLGKWLVVSDSKKFIERIALADVGSLPRLVNVLEYELVSAELGGKLDGEEPFLVSFVRSAEYVRQFYELAQSDQTRGLLRQAGENNQAASKMSQLLQQNELPPFEQFQKYFAPSGSFAYDEAGGMHFGTFTLKADN